MIAFRVTTGGNLELSLQSAGMRVREAVRTGVQRAGDLVLTRAKEKLSGEVLRNRTGQLRRSINQRFRDSGTRIETQVGTNVKYAAIHEYGFDGPETVKAHARKISHAFGRTIAPTVVQVRSFERRVRMPERSFLRSSLNELRPQIEATIRQRVIAALEGSA